MLPSIATAVPILTSPVTTGMGWHQQQLRPLRFTQSYKAAHPSLTPPGQVTQAERLLRGALLVDGLKPESGYKLARYNDPFTLPPFRRNEVLIRLEEFEM